MSLARNNRSVSPINDPGAKVAHELANLLDAGLRNIGLVIASLRSHDQPPVPIQLHDHDDPVQRLQTINITMQQMARLLHQWNRSPQSIPAVLLPDETLSGIIDHAVRLLQPATKEADVTIEVSLSPQAAETAAGCIFTVIINALRNSLDTMEHPTIRIIGRIEKDDVVISIQDDGPGIDPSLFDEHGAFRFGVTTKSHGHGLGLLTSRDIAHALGGDLTLQNLPQHGTQLNLRYPLTPIMHQTTEHTEKIE